MIICSKCISWRVRTTQEGVIKYSRCTSCGQIEIIYIGQSLQLFRCRQLLRLLRRSSWVYVIFILIILGGSYLISTMMTAPAKHSALPNLPVASPTGTGNMSLRQTEKILVVANSNSKLYHLPGMKYYNNISKHHRVIFTSEEEAKRASYRKAPR